MFATVLCSGRRGWWEVEGMVEREEGGGREQGGVEGEDGGGGREEKGGWSEGGDVLTSEVATHPKMGVAALPQQVVMLPVIIIIKTLFTDGVHISRNP